MLLSCLEGQTQLNIGIPEPDRSEKSQKYEGVFRVKANRNRPWHKWHARDGDKFIGCYPTEEIAARAFDLHVSSTGARDTSILNFPEDLEASKAIVNEQDEFAALERQAQMDKKAHGGAYMGVTFDKNKKCWLMQAVKNEQYIFPNPELAARAYDTLISLVPPRTRLLNFPAEVGTSKEKVKKFLQDKFAEEDAKRSSQYYGVVKQDQNGKIRWAARIYVKRGQAPHLAGTFPEEELAARMVDVFMADNHLQREFNFPGELEKSRRLLKSFEETIEHRTPPKPVSGYYGVIANGSATAKGWVCRGPGNKYLGKFKTSEDAARVYDAALAEYEAEHGTLRQGKKLIGSKVYAYNFPGDKAESQRRTKELKDEAKRAAREPAKKTKKHTSSKYRGVWLNPANGKYHALARDRNGVQQKVAVLESEIDAARAYDRFLVRKKLVGVGKGTNCRKLNFPEEEQTRLAECRAADGASDADADVCSPSDSDATEDESD